MFIIIMHLAIHNTHIIRSYLIVNKRNCINKKCVDVDIDYTI